MPTELKTRLHTKQATAATSSPVAPVRPQTILHLIGTAFASGSARSPIKPVTFEWRLIRRNQWPFLLLPAGAEVRVGLRLYSAQRRRAKIARALFPLLFHTPAAVLFERLTFNADAGSEFLQFLARQSGVPVAQFMTPAVKFGGVENKSRLVLLLCDETKRPVSVVKVGLDSAGRMATDREADLLAQLPPEKIGCIRMTGRFSRPNVSAFATAYFPGESPVDDAGLEHLFYDWLNPGPAVPIESLEIWHELEAAAGTLNPSAWQTVRRELAGRSIRTTLYHGDFAPWNIRAINARNLQAFDWERGSLQGIPGWDWFHFIVQTAVLARRFSVERVAAEIEQVLYSERFKKYAAAAGISDCVKPLFLACLLHQKWVVKPLEGGPVTYELFKLLAARWRMNERSQLNDHYVMPPPESPGLGWRADARLQIKFAVSRLRNLFWEPSLSSLVRPSLVARGRAHWRMISGVGLLLAAVILVQSHANPHFLFMPLYMIPCALMTWKVDRRWGILTAIIAGTAGPLVQRLADPDFLPSGVVGWNLTMRILILLMSVILFDRILQQKKLGAPGEGMNGHSVKITDNWAVLGANIIWLAAVIIIQIYSSPHLVFLPLYLVPCAALTLTMGRYWGMAAAALSAAAGPMVQRFGDPDYEVPMVEFWNIIMRLIILQGIVLLLDELHRKNILYFPKAPQKRAGAGDGK